jgi:hypothetical protein
MTYKITDYSKKQAEKYDVQIKPSKKKQKKIDVYKNGTLIASIGDIRYNDYGKYLEVNKEHALKRRKLYRQRHKNDLNSKNGKWANLILW